MYKRLVTFKASKEKEAEIKEIGKKYIPMIESQPGCKGCKFLLDGDGGNYGMLIAWENPELAAKAKALIGPELIPLFQKVAEGEVSIILYEVYDGK
jgi:hypothetical protein